MVTGCTAPEAASARALLIHDVVLEEDDRGMVRLPLFTHLQEAPLQVFTGPAGSFEDVQHHQRVAVGAVQHVLELLCCKSGTSGGQLVGPSEVS